MAFIFDLKVGCNHEVDVTHINNPKSFFVRSAKVGDLLDLIEKPGPGPVTVSDATITIGRRVVYRSKIIGKFIRGEIRFVNTKGENVDCDLFAIDYGCFDRAVPTKDIYLPNPRAEPHNQCPGLAFHCQLYVCEPLGDTFSDEVIGSMRSFIGEHTATATVISKICEQLVIELRTVDCPREVGMMLVLMDQATFVKGPYTVHRFLNQPAVSNLVHVLKYTHKHYNVGDILHVRVQSGSSASSFYVADVNEFKTLRSAQPAFSEYCKNREIREEDIVPGRPCGVKLDNLGEYERAIVKDVMLPISKAILHLVDWGKDIESPFSRMRSIDREFFLTQPVVAIYCSTSEDQLWESGLPKFFFQGYEFGIKIMELGNNVDIPHKVNIYPLKMLKFY